MTDALYCSHLYQATLDLGMSSVIGLERLASKTVLVTGANGLIGSFIVDMLANASRAANLSIHIIAAGRSKERLVSRFGGNPFSGLEFEVFDVSGELPKGLRADFVIHAASNAHPGAFVGDPVGTILANVSGLANLAELSLQCGARLLYVSSGEVYGRVDDGRAAFDEGCYGYVDVLSPRSAYPMGKRAAETLLASYVAQCGLDAVIVRPCHTYGPTATTTDTRANAAFVLDALAGRNIVLKSTGTQVRSYNYVADAVSGLLTVLAKGEAGEAYNLANPDVRVSIAQFAEAVALNAGVRVEKRLPTEAEARLASPVPNQVLDSGKLEALGWQAAYSLDRGVSVTLKIMEEVHARRT